MYWIKATCWNALSLYQKLNTLWSHLFQSLSNKLKLTVKCLQMQHDSIIPHLMICKYPAFKKLQQINQRTLDVPVQIFYCYTYNRCCLSPFLLWTYQSEKHVKQVDFLYQNTELNIVITCISFNSIWKIWKGFNFYKLQDKHLNYYLVCTV